MSATEDDAPEEKSEETEGELSQEQLNDTAGAGWHYQGWEWSDSGGYWHPDDDYYYSYD